MGVTIETTGHNTNSLTKNSLNILVYTAYVFT